VGFERCCTVDRLGQSGLVPGRCKSPAEEIITGPGFPGVGDTSRTDSVRGPDNPLAQMPKINPRKGVGAARSIRIRRRAEGLSDIDAPLCSSRKRARED